MMATEAKQVVNKEARSNLKTSCFDVLLVDSQTKDVLPVDDTKRYLLTHYAHKPVTAFRQLDGSFFGEPLGDDIVQPDEDGDYCTTGNTFELMHGADVRILIRHGTSYKDALRLLNKLYVWLSRGYQFVDFFGPEEMPEKALEVELDRAIEGSD
jgi:hypothetical protein